MKAERRSSILEGARAYLAQRGFDEVRLVDLAAELGLVKGTLYLYFPTKQELFLAILVEELEAWWAEAVAEAAREPVEKALGCSLARRELLLRLLPSLHMTIEPGLTEDGLADFKRWFAGFAAKAASDIAGHYPAVAHEALPFLFGFYALALGSSQLAFPPERVKKLLLAEPALEAFRLDFMLFFPAAVERLYKGYAAGAGGEVP